MECDHGFQESSYRILTIIPNMPSVDPERFVFAECVVYAQLYDRVRDELTQLVLDETKHHDNHRLKRGFKRSMFPVTASIKQRVLDMYSAAQDEYLAAGESGHAHAVAVLAANNNLKLQCVIMFHRFVMDIYDADNNGLEVTKAQVVDQLEHLNVKKTSPTSTSLEMFRTGSCYIGKPHTVAMHMPNGLDSILMLCSDKWGKNYTKKKILDTCNAFKGQTV